MFEALGAPGIGAEALIASLTSPGMAAGLVIGASVTLSVSLGAQKFIDWRERTRPMRACRAMLKREAARACAGHSELPWTLEESRPRFIAAGVRPAPEGVRSAGPDEAMSPAPGHERFGERFGAGNPGFSVSPALVKASSAGRFERVPAPGVVAAPVFSPVVAPVNAPGPHLIMRPLDHVSEYLAHERANSLGKNPVSGRWECRRSSADVLANYRRWAHARSLMTVPEWQFLNLLAQQPGVEKKRDRLKDANGRVPRTEGGSPERTNYYTIVELPPVVAAESGRRRKWA